MNNSTIAIIVIVVILVIIFGAFGIYEVTKTSPTTPPPNLSSAGYDGPADPFTIPPMPTAPPTTPSPTAGVPTPSPGSITPPWNVPGANISGPNVLLQNKFLSQGDQLVASPATYALHFAGANDPNNQPQGQIYVANAQGTVSYTFFNSTNNVAVNPNNWYLSIGTDGVLRCFDKNLITTLTVSPNPGVALVMWSNGNLTLYKDPQLTLPVWTTGLVGFTSGDDLYISSSEAAAPI